MRIKKCYGGGAIIIICFFLAMVLVVGSIVINLSKQKTVQRAVSQEYSLRTYYIALAGINECIATRMAPRSNTVIHRQDISKKDLTSLDRIYDSGKVYLNPSDEENKALIGEYTYVSSVVVDSKEKGTVIDEFTSDEDNIKYLVYSEGISTRDDGQEDKLIIEAIFDLNRFDSDPFNADEMESISIIPTSSSRFMVLEDFINKVKEDEEYPMVREITFNAYNGEEIKYGVHSNEDKLHVSGVGIRSKVNIQFTEPIDAKFLEGVTLKDLTHHKTLENVEKIALSPRNLEVLLLPEDKSGGRMFDYATNYKLEINDVIDMNGNVLPNGPEITFNTVSNASGEVVSSPDSQSSASDNNPFQAP